MGWKKLLLIFGGGAILGAGLLFVGLIILVLIFASTPTQNNTQQFQIQNQPSQNTVQPPDIAPQQKYGPQSTMTAIDCAIIANAVRQYNTTKFQLPDGVTQEDVQNCVFLQQNYCNKIEPNNIEVLKAVSQATTKDAGAYSLDQVIDSYQWVKQNIHYLNVPLDQAAPRNPEDTIAIGAGDCKNMAVLISSMVAAISGTSRVVIVPECTHAYAQVYVGDSTVDTQQLANSISARYPDMQGNIFTQKVNNQTWLTLDVAGANYAGAVLPQCLNATKEYIVTKC